MTAANRHHNSIEMFFWPVFNVILLDVFMSCRFQGVNCFEVVYNMKIGIDPLSVSAQPQQRNSSLITIWYIDKKRKRNAGSNLN